VELSSLVDAGRVRSTAGSYLSSLGTLGPDESWPAAEGRFYGATFATEAASLVWYPRAAFAWAGYSVPRTLAELNALTDRMVADGRTPWCLGLGAGFRHTRSEGASAVDFVEELMLRASGATEYDSWAAGIDTFRAAPVRQAFVDLGVIAFGDGRILGGVGAAMRTPGDLASWPMFTDPPGCWLHLAGGSDRVAWPAGGAGTLAAFPFPAADLAHGGEVRGRAFTVVVFHDRPEVRRFVDSLLGDAFGGPRETAFVPAGIWPLETAAATTIGVAGPDGALLLDALRTGDFRVSASDLMPARVTSAFTHGVMSYLTGGPISLNGVLDQIQRSWREAP